MSAVRDLGYKPYEGTRLPPSHNAWVMFRHGLSRAWESWLVKLAVVFGLLPGFVHIVILAGVAYYMGAQLSASPNGLEIYASVRKMLTYQLWIFASAVTLGAGASALTEDAAFRTFPFYFAKPVTPVHYVVGRVGAVAALCAFLFFVPSTLMVLVGAAVEGESRRVATLELLPKVLAFTLLASVSLSSISVGISAFGRSRAFTMSMWLLIFVVPFVIAGMIEALTHWPWLGLTSIPSMLDVVEEALFEPELEEKALRWYHAVLMLTGLTVGSITFTLNRLRRAEVIA